MIQGYAKFSNDKIVLGFIKEAPIFQEHLNSPIHELIEDDTNQPVAYSVVSEKDGKHGFLFYSFEQQKAEDLVLKLQEQMKQPYKCIPLKLKTVN